MRRNNVISLVGIVVVTATLGIWILAGGHSIALGIDLDGGVEVGLEPTEDTELEGAELDDALDISVEILRNRVDGLGVVEPDITRQGNRIVVQLPGVEDQQRAVEIIGATAELRFRPVCAVLPAQALADSDGEPVDPDDVDADGVRDAPFGIDASDIDPAPGDPAAGAAPLGCTDIDITPQQALTLPSTTREGDEAEVPVILPELRDGEVVARYLLGRTYCFDETTLGVPDEERTGACVPLTGAALDGADSTFDGVEWAVLPTFKDGPQGIGSFNAAAQECFGTTASCPTGQLAIVLDGNVVSAPSVNVPFFERDAVRISGAFDQERAEDLTLQLRYGALPIEFEDPTDPDSRSTVTNVSATLGRDSLDAGIVAGLIGIALVGAYIIFYYRLLGVAALLSLVVSGSLTLIVLTWLSESQGLALTLAGVVGLVVSVGTALDSNVVYFETIREDVSNGRTVRSAVDRSFQAAFRTIFFANLTSLIGAGILWWLTIGSVRGFALILGLASILDLVATWFFLRPLVHLLATRPGLMSRPGLFGVPMRGRDPELEVEVAR